jgi:hypothetical protein
LKNRQLLKQKSGQNVPNRQKVAFFAAVIIFSPLEDLIKATVFNQQPEASFPRGEILPSGVNFVPLGVNVSPRSEGPLFF